jgi:hypothetical protein
MNRQRHIFICRTSEQRIARVVMYALWTLLTFVIVTH